MVSLPSRGPRIGSNHSSKFSTRTTSSAARALSIASRYLSGKKKILKNKSESLCQHLHQQRKTMCTFHYKASHSLCPMLMTRRSSRVHHEGPLLAGSENGGVLSGHPASWQTFILPCRHIHVIRQHG